MPCVLHCVTGEFKNTALQVQYFYLQLSLFHFAHANICTVMFKWGPQSVLMDWYSAISSFATILVWLFKNVCKVHANVFLTWKRWERGGGGEVSNTPPKFYNFSCACLHAHIQTHTWTCMKNSWTPPPLPPQKNFWYAIDFPWRISRVSQIINMQSMLPQERFSQKLLLSWSKRISN